MPDLKHTLTQPPGRTAPLSATAGKGALAEQHRGASVDASVPAARAAKAQQPPRAMGADCMRIFLSR